MEERRVRRDETSKSFSEATILEGGGVKGRVISVEAGPLALCSVRRAKPA